MVAGPSSATSGASFTLTVTALDGYGNVATGYTGNVKFTSSDHAAALPTNYSFGSADQGVHVYTVTLFTNGSQTITATDQTSSSIKGSLTGPAGIESDSLPCQATIPTHKQPEKQSGT